jgi:CheY-like chemotaxis protein
MLSSIWRDLDDAAMSVLGIRAYLTKPVRQSQLFNTLVRVIHAERADAQEPSPPRPEAPSSLAAAGRRVLLVEDNPVNQELAQEMLLSLGLQVDVAEDGQRALAAYGSEQYALVLMDCQMPVLDGFEATRRLRALEQAVGEGARMPVIALTANALSGDREACIDAGMDDYLSKPFTLAQLAETVGRWLPTVAADKEASGSTPPEPEQVRLDPAALDAVRALQRPGAPDLAQKVITLYLQSAEGLVVDLERAAASRDAGALTSAAHSLKSASGNVGATHLCSLCRSLESDSRAGELEGAEARVRAVAAEFSAVAEALERRAAPAPGRAEAVA